MDTKISIDTMHEYGAAALDAVTLYRETIANFLCNGYELDRDHAYRVVELISFEHIDLELGLVSRDCFYVNKDARYMIDLFNVSHKTDDCIVAYLNPLGLDKLIAETK